MALELGYKASRDKGLSEANLLTAAMAALRGEQPGSAKALDVAQLCAALHTNRLLRSRRSVAGPLSVSPAGPRRKQISRLSSMRQHAVPAHGRSADEVGT